LKLHSAEAARKRLAKHFQQENKNLDLISEPMLTASITEVKDNFGWNSGF